MCNQRGLINIFFRCTQLIPHFEQGAGKSSEKKKAQRLIAPELKLCLAFGEKFSRNVRLQSRLHPKSAVYLPSLLCNLVSSPHSFTPHLSSACLPHICSSSANCFPETSVFIRTSLPHQASLFTAYATFNSPSLTDYCSRFKLFYHAAWFVFSVAFASLFTCQIYLPLVYANYTPHGLHVGLAFENRRKNKA